MVCSDLHSKQSKCSSAEAGTQSSENWCTHHLNGAHLNHCVPMKRKPQNSLKPQSCLVVATIFIIIQNFKEPHVHDIFAERTDTSRSNPWQYEGSPMSAEPCCTAQTSQDRNFQQSHGATAEHTAHSRTF